MLNSSAEVVAGGAAAGFTVSDELRASAGGAGSASVVSVEVRALGADVDSGCVSVSVAGVSSSGGDDVSRASVAAVSERRALVDIRRSALRNRRHVSELLSVAAVVWRKAPLPPAGLLAFTSNL